MSWDFYAEIRQMDHHTVLNFVQWTTTPSDQFIVDLSWERLHQSANPGNHYNVVVMYMLELDALRSEDAA